MTSTTSCITARLTPAAGQPTSAIWLLARPWCGALALGSALLLVACTKTEPAPEPVRAVRTLTVSTGTAGARWDYAAEVKARTESRLGFRVGGKLLERPAQLGANVKRGQVLARLDAQDLRLAQQGASAALAAAQAQAAQAQADFQRVKDLNDKGFVGPADLERRDTALKAAKAQVAQAQAQLAAQGNQAGYSVLVADAPGVITAIEAEPGMVVSAGAPVVRLAWDGARDAVFAVPEERLAATRALLGQPGALAVRSGAGSGTAAGTGGGAGMDAAVWRATLREVSAAADPATRTYLAKADLGAAPARLGQSATVMIELPGQPGVIKLPLTAVMEQQGRSAVWVLDSASMTVKVQPITVAGADANEVVVAQGLQAGQVVVTAGVHTLTPGQKVKLYGAAPGASAAAAPAVAAASAAAR